MARLVAANLHGVGGMLESPQVIGRTPTSLLERVLPANIGLNDFANSVEPDPARRIDGIQQTQYLSNGFVVGCELKEAHCAGWRWC
ncbi:hypothetical protein V8921_22055 [Ralstonia mannitolilytica]|uniref:hypothetical protein n=1 Tax=Ralstonia mannitolilytica TaxID=105219 RepID=UPI003B896D79